jgi:MFS family permease
MARAINILWVFVPFVAGYLLSYLFRTISGPLADRLVGEFSWDARTLGLLTSANFLTFSTCQLPLGALVDRYGPRRVQAALSLVAASGACLFGFGQNLAALIVARALIGLGTSGALMAGLKGLNMGVARSRLAALNGFYVMCGGLGAMASTYPVDRLTQAVGWRGPDARSYVSPIFHDLVRRLSRLSPAQATNCHRTEKVGERGDKHQATMFQRGGDLHG